MITVSKKWIRLIGIVGCTVWMASCKQASDAGVKSSSYAVMQIEAVDKEFSSSYSATIRGRQDIDIYPNGKQRQQHCASAWLFCFSQDFRPHL